MSDINPRIRMMKWKRAVLICGVIATLILPATVLITPIQGAPFRMTARRSDGQTFVRFLWPDEGLASPEFRVALPIDSPREIELRSAKSAPPGVSIEFCDTTILPGRFQIRIGSSLYDVMERGIIVDGKEFDWQHP
jgi:hypothetical protein